MSVATKVVSIEAPEVTERDRRAEEPSFRADTVGGRRDAIALVAFRIPDIVLSRVARMWRRAASSEIPLLLDLLAVTPSAGLAPQVAVRVAVQQVRGPIGDELRRALARADFGRRWRDELTAVADRLGLRDLRRMVVVVRRTETLGASTAGENRTGGGGRAFRKESQSGRTGCCLRFGLRVVPHVRATVRTRAVCRI